MTPLTVALDWTPNTNHVGFFVAQAKGWFTEAGLDVKILSATDPAVLEYKTPAKAVANGVADFAVTPSESALSFHTNSKEGPSPVAVAALLQGSTSAIAARKESGIEEPKQLAGKRYASYGGRFEDAIVRTMVDNNGGDGQLVEFVALESHGYADDGVQQEGFLSSLKTGSADATWIFSHWEGLLATDKGVELNLFSLEKYGCPYGYAPVLLAHPTLLSERKDVGQKFLQVVARGYQFAVEHVQEASQCLAQASNHPSCQDVSFLTRSLQMLAPFVLTPEKTWGRMDKARWTNFVDFCFAKGIVTNRSGDKLDRACVNVDDLFSNELLS